MNAWQQAPTKSSDSTENINNAQKNSAQKDQGLNSEQLNQLIEQLDSNKFLIRENATEDLLAADSSIIIPIANAASSGSLEKGMRCLHILKQFAIGDDIDAEIESMRQLTKIAVDDKARISDYANDILKKIGPLQTERAIRVLRSLGILFNQFSPSPGVVPRLTINDDYRGTVDQLHYLQHLDFVQDVFITGDKISAPMLVQIAKMPSVHLMSIKDGPVDLKMLKALSPILPKLTALHLYYLPLDDQAIPLMSTMTSLIKCQFFGLNLSEKGQIELLEKLPKAVSEFSLIPFRNGGFLGVRSDSTLGGCIFSEVLPDGGAADADAEEEDEVIQVDDTKVTSFADLTEHLINKRAGNSIDLIVLRDGKEIELRVTLKKWPMLDNYR